MTIQQQIEGKIQTERKTKKKRQTGKKQQTIETEKQENEKNNHTDTKKKQIGRQKDSQRGEDISINIGRRHNTRK